MEAAPEPTPGMTPAMTFAVGYLREFPGAGYDRVRKAALSHGIPALAPIIYGNALRILRAQAQPSDVSAATRIPPQGRRRRRRAARGLDELSGLVEQMQAVVAERNRLRQAIDQIADAVRSVRRG